MGRGVPTGGRIGGAEWDRGTQWRDSGAARLQSKVLSVRLWRWRSLPCGRGGGRVRDRRMGRPRYEVATT